MGKSGIVSPDDISLEEFNKTLARYPSVIRAVSETKGGKSCQSSPILDASLAKATGPGQPNPARNH